MGPATLELEKLPVSTEFVTIYQLKGKLALETVSTFVQRLRAETVPHMILDLGGVSYLDSAGVGSLVSIFVSRRNHGRSFALASLTPQSSAVVTVAGLQKLLPVFKTVDEALAQKPQ
jgi:anti-sigma B factor antagonist